MSIKKSNDTIGNRTRDLPACSAVPQPTTPPRAPSRLEGIGVISGSKLFSDCQIEPRFVYTTTHCSLKAYCAIWVRRSNFRHQASPRMSPRESTQRRKVELWARNVQLFCLNADVNVTFRDLLHAVKLRHGTDGFTSPPKEGFFFALKIRRLRPGANPRTWVPKASTLPLDYRSRFRAEVRNEWGCTSARSTAVMA